MAKGAPRPTRVTLSAVAKSNWIPLDRFSPHKHFSVSLSSGAGLTYSVEFTDEDVQDPAFNPTSAVVLTHTDLTAKTVSAFLAGEYLFQAVRLNVTARTAGSATLTVAQG